MKGAAQAVVHPAGVAGFAAGVGASVVWGLTLVMGMVLTVVYLVLVGPLCDRMSERIERHVRGSRAGKASTLGVLRDVLHDVPRLMLFGMCLGIVWVGSWLWRPILPLGTFVVFSRYLAYNSLDYCMARGHLGILAKRRWLAHHRAPTWGLGCAAAGLSLVPVANLLMPALAAAGGTLLFAELTDGEAARAAA
jgi:uncharacterized protein involved in cysteine biosynthesis